MKKEKTNRKESFSVIREKIVTLTAEAAEGMKVRMRVDGMI